MISWTPVASLSHAEFATKLLQEDLNIGEHTTGPQLANATLLVVALSWGKSAAVYNGRSFTEYWPRPYLFLCGMLSVCAL